VKTSANIEWKNNLQFTADVDGYKIDLDTDTDSGGSGNGVKPKPLMLVALGGCTGMDVVSILKKMRVEFDKLNIIVEGDAREEHPKKYTEIKVIYEFEGKNLDLDKIKKAVSLSEEKYCSVNAVYKEVIKMTSEIRIV
jgi:putative redox protein